MTNEQRLAQLWAYAGQSIDEQRLRIFRLMTANEQREILEQIEQIEREQTMKINKNTGLLI